MKQYITSGTKKLNINGQTLQGYIRVKYTVEDFYKSYKTLDKTADEIVTKIRFQQPEGDYHFNLRVFGF